MNSFRLALSIVPFDLKNVLRDELLYLIIAVTGVFLAAIAFVGFNADALGAAGLRPFMKYLTIFALMALPVNFGLVFGLLLIEETETGARAALATTPAAPAVLALWRTPIAAFMVFALGWFYVLALNVAWDGPPLSRLQWGGVIVCAAALTPWVTLSLSTLASTRIEALALGKAYSAITGPPILLYLTPPDALWRHLFLLFPTTPMLKAYDAFLAGADRAAVLWIAWGLAYAALLTFLAVLRMR